MSEQIKNSEQQNTNNENNQANNNQNEDQENQGGFFNSFIFKIIIFYMISNIFSKLIQGNINNNNKGNNNNRENINSLQMKNLLNENNLFDIEFFVSKNSNLNRNHFLKKEIKPIFIFQNLNYSNENINTTEFTKEIELKFPINKYIELLLDFDESLFYANSTMKNSTEFIEKKNKIEKMYNTKTNQILKNEALYLYSFLKLKNFDLKNNLKSFKNIEVLTSKINLLKFSENLGSQIHQQNMLNDIESADSTENTEFKNPDNSKNEGNENFSNKKFLKNLYIKPEITFYVTKFNEKEDIENFQEFKMMKISPGMDYEKFRFCPNNFLTDFWTLSSDLKYLTVNKDDLEKINNEKNKNSNKDQKDQKEIFSTFKIKINFNFLSNFYLKYMRAIDMNGEMMENTFNIPSSKDMFVELLKNNSMSYLALLFTVNLLHTVFSYMGFASDVSYYQNLKELDGVYTKYILFSLFRILVTFIYVTLEDAHFLVKFELFVALLIETWKLRKIFYVTFSLKFPFIEMGYKIKFASEESQSHETEAISLMTKWLFMPIAVLYLSYRIYYYKQTVFSSYFKFFIQYLFFLFNLFGFVLMTPQIYLNYKLKTVEHMPVKALTYKFLNTIIDDLYAFAIKTTTLYRISCFKDDVIFVIFIFQMFIYRNNTNKIAKVEIELKENLENDKKEKEGNGGNELIEKENEKEKENLKSN